MTPRSHPSSPARLARQLQGHMRRTGCASVCRDALRRARPASRPQESGCRGARYVVSEPCPGMPLGLKSPQESVPGNREQDPQHGVTPGR